MLKTLRFTVAAAFGVGTFALIWTLAITIGAAIALRSVWPIESLTLQLAWDTFWTTTSWEGWSGDISWYGAAIAGVGAAIVTFLMLRVTSAVGLTPGRTKMKTVHVRGVQIATRTRLAYCDIITRGLPRADRAAFIAKWRYRSPNAIVRESARRGFLPLGGVPMPHECEPLHTLITASTGAGKSTYLRELIGGLMERGDKAIVFDSRGEFSTDYCCSDDIILAPKHPRSVGWDLRNEAPSPSFWVHLATAVIPTGNGDNAHWTAFGQTLLAEMGKRIGAACTNQQLINTIVSSTKEELLEVLQGTTAQPYLEHETSDFMSSVRSMASTEFLSWDEQKSGDFSLRDYIQGDDRRWLWIPYEPSNLQSMRRLISCWLDILVTAGLERASDSEPKTWIIIDELDNLGCIESLVTAAAQLRKPNIRIVAAIQTYSQLIGTYGPHKAATLLGNLSNKLVLKVVDGELQKRIADDLGNAEVIDEHPQISVAQTAGRHRSRSETISVNRAHRIRQAVLGSELGILPPLHGFVKFSGQYDLIRTRPPKFKKRVPKAKPESSER